MKLFTADKIREADKYTIENEPVSSVDLMERAAHQLTLWIIFRYPRQAHFMFFAGPGNNGGDAWALARMLWKKGFTNISFYLLKISEHLSPDSEKTGSG